jgi:hypothetical protein
VISRIAISLLVLAAACAKGDTSRGGEGRI